MKILLVLHNHPEGSTGGAEIHAMDMALELAARHRVKIACRIVERGLEEGELCRSSSRGIEIVGLNNTLKGAGSFSKMFVNEMVDEIWSRLLEDEKPDIVHIHHLAGLSFGIAPVTASRGIPTLMSIHDYCLLCPRGQMIRDDLGRCSTGSESLCVQCLDPRRTVRSFVRRMARHLKIGRGTETGAFETYARGARRLGDAVSAFIVPSTFVSREFRRLGFPGKRIHIVPHGIPRFDSDTPPRHDETDPFVFGYMGSLIPSKGVHVAIDAFRTLREEDVSLHIFGPSPPYHGDGRYADRLRGAAASDRRIRFLGSYAHQEYPRILAAIDALVIPSLWNEFFSLVLHEARLYRVPVIASRLGALEEYVTDGEDGFLFPPGDEKELAGIMRLLYRDRHLHRSLAESAPLPRTVSECAADLENIYLSL